MPAIAGDGHPTPGTFAVRTAIFAPLRHRAIATRMGAFLDVLFGHVPLLGYIGYHDQRSDATVSGNCPQGGKSFNGNLTSDGWRSTRVLDSSGAHAIRRS